MQQYKDILVIIDPAHSQQPALERAMQLSKAQGDVSFTLFMAIFDFSYEMTAMFSLEERESMRSALVHDRKLWLRELIQPYQLDNDKIMLKVVWHKRPFEAIIEQVIKHQHDLVIKSTHNHPKLQSIIFTPTDWHLLRKCPASLLLVKAHNWPENGKIVVAINCVEDSEHHRVLNKKLIEHSKAIAQLLNGQVHLVNAFPSMPVNLALELPEFDVTDYTETVRLQHKALLDKLAKRYDIPEDQLHLIEGQPEYAVADYATEMDAELVVLGTIGRSGFSAVIIGNTAEHIIDRLECDLLAIKPEGYISPFEK